MKLHQLFENAERLDYTVTGDWSKRIFVEGRLKSGVQNWLDAAWPDRVIVEATYDITENGECLYRNQINAHKRGSGYAAELQKFIISEAKKHGVLRTKGYIEHVNSNAQSMARKLGFTELETQKHGSIWGKDL